MSGTAPVITSSADVSIDENILLAHTVTATDAELDNLTFSIIGGVDRSLFTINSATGAISFKTAPDFEAPGDANDDNVYEIQVRVNDGSNSVVQNITITVDNVTGDLIEGTVGDDTLGEFDATSEEDEVLGFGGNDTLFGLGGNDLMDGGDGNDVIDGGTGADVMFGGDGDDTFYVDNVLDQVFEGTNVGSGHDKVYSSVSFTMGATDGIDDLELTGNTAINGTGNNFVNTITGNSRANVIDGGQGADTMIGGNGDDTYIVDNVGDTVVEIVSNGVDTVQSSVNYTLANFVDRLQLTGTATTGTGNNLANVLTGNASNNTLNGLDGADTLNGGDGTDTLVGGNGDDIYVVDSTTDTITEAENAGNDTVQSSVDYDGGLADNVENLTLTGTTATTGRGNLADNVLIGNSADNTLRGLAGDDRLNGGTGADWMAGNTGNDVYIVDNDLDVIVELAAQGQDKVISTRTWTLADNVENLELDGGSAINGTGNTSNNFLLGNNAANILSGLDGNDKLNGGLGNDTMIGGLGNDVFVVNQAGDSVVELDGEGTDTVQTSISYTLDAQVERLIMTGLNAIDGVGNDNDNFMRGNIKNNELDGGVGNDILNGGGGDDTMIGGAGNDTYYISSLLDVVTEVAGEGTDLLYLGRSGYTLADEVENMIFQGISTNINGNGNALDNEITGNNGKNVINGGAGADTILGNGGADTLLGGDGDDELNGGAGDDAIAGGAGADLMTGGTGNDRFVFTALTDSGTDAGVDTDMITDYAQNEKVDISAIDAITGAGTANDTFVMDADNIYTAGEVELTQVGNVVTVELFTDSVAGADMVFEITLGVGVTGVTFLL